MMETQPQEQSKAHSLNGGSSPLYLIERVINIFGMVVKFTLLIGFLVMLLYGALIVTPIVMQFFPSSTGVAAGGALRPAETQAVLQLIDSTYEKLTPVVGEFWSLLKPILLLSAIALLLRWLFLSQHGPLAGHVQNLDAITLIAILVICAIALVAILGLAIPEPLANLAIIIAILVLVRGLLFAQHGQLSEHWRGLDVPSMVAMLVVGTLALAAILQFAIPTPLANVAVIVVVLVLVRWLFVQHGGSIEGQLRNLIVDVPSVIAILVIGTVALITILGMEIPQALANVALVIVGFYFGQDRLKRAMAHEDPNLAQSGPKHAPSSDEASEP